MDSGGVEGGGEKSASLTAAEEALKRNTDCIYFLASPLTCKKGSECEYRHNEGARFNTRDCWYWYNGNCLNPKCSFRHPPLDGLLEASGTASASSQIPLDSAASLTSTLLIPGQAAAYNTNKQNVPCYYYFQKGYCVKGNRCPFMHSLQPTSSADLKQVPVISASPSDQPLTKVAKIPKGNVSDSKGGSTVFDEEMELLPNSVGPTFHTEGNRFSPEGRPFYQNHDELAGFGPRNVPLENGDTRTLALSWASRSLDEQVQNGMESDEFLGESSPGFDVLVDDQVEESDYFQNEDEYVQSPANGISFVNDFEYKRPEYEPVRLDRNQYKEMREYERYGSIHHEQRLASRRSVERPQFRERTLRRERSYDKMDKSDLRHRLAKKRRIDGRKSDIAADHSHRGNEYSTQDRYNSRRSHWDDQPFPKEPSISSRLRGRIAIPVSSSLDKPVSPQREMEKDRRRNRHRLSPVRRIDHQFGHCSKVKRKLSEQSRSSEEQTGHRTMTRGDADSLDFVGPKSLAELQSSKISCSNGDKSSNPRKDIDGGKSEASLSFEAPKSLSVILKRKREMASEHLSVAEVASTHNPSMFASGNDEDDKDLPDNGCFSAQRDMYESEDGMVNRMVDQGLDNYRQKSGEFDNEEEKGGEDIEDESEAVYIDNYDDDEDDFAKKVGVMLS